MTDAELLAMIEEKEPAELTADEISRLRAAVQTSPEIAGAVRDRLELEQCLFHTLGHPHLSVEKILARARGRAVGGRGRRLALLIGLPLCLLAAAVSVGWFVRQPRGGGAAPAAALGDGKQSSETASTEAPIKSPSTPASDDASPGDASTLPATASSDEAASPAAADERDQEPVDPAAADILFQGIPPRAPALTAATIGRWLEPMAERPGAAAGSIQDGRLIGLHRLRDPLLPGSGLRVAIHEMSGLRIHVWSGTAGVTVDAASYLGPLFAYATTRRGDDALPSGYVLAARDDGRMWRTAPVHPVLFDLRHENGLLTLSRGDVRILDVPLATAPTEIFFEGPAPIPQLLAVVPAAPLPPRAAVTDRAAAPVAVTAAPGAASPWIVPPTMDPGCVVEFPAAGSVRLSARGTTQPAWAMLPLPEASGPREVVVQVDGFDPGMGLAIGEAAGSPHHVIAFRANQHDTVLRQIVYAQPDDNRIDAAGRPQDGAIAFVGSRTWLKLTHCGGWLTVQTSADGVHWVHASGPHETPPLGAIGLHAVAHASPRAITVGRVETRPFTQLMALARVDAPGSPASLPDAGPLAAWHSIAIKAKPADVAEREWLRACAVQQLGRACHPALAVDLMELLWRASLAQTIDFDSRLALLDEFAALAPVWKSPADAARVAGWYTELGQWLADRAEPLCYSQVALRQQTCPLLSEQPFGFFSSGLARRELAGHVVAARWHDLRSLGQRTAFFNLPGTPLPLFAWAARTSRTARTAEWRHPVAADLGKHGVAAEADIRAALAEDDVRRACELLGHAALDPEMGLIADWSDPDLIATLPSLGASLVRDDPRIRTTMRADFARQAEVRLKRAIDTADPALLRTVTLQYPGTAAAARAHLLLGDRHLAAGELPQARWQYRAARIADPDIEAAHRRAGYDVAAAIEGAAALPEPEASAAEAAVTIGAASLSAAEWRAIADGIRAARSGLPAATRFATGGTVVAKLPPVGTYTIVEMARLEGEAGAEPEKQLLEYAITDGPAPEWLDWVARHTSMAVAESRLLVSNRFQVAAHDAATGQLQWRSGVGDDAAAAHAWPGQPMRPVVGTAHVFVRRLRKDGPTLASMHLADGAVVWETKPREPGQVVASDPLLVDETLHAVTATPILDGWTLALATFSASTGELRAERQLFALRSSAGALSPGCQLLPVGDTFVVVCAGGVVCCDPDLNIRWLRREPWVPPSVDPTWQFTVQAPPLVVSGTMFVAQPSVPAVFAIDGGSGRAAWKTPLVGIRRVLGTARAAQRRLLVVERAGGFTALDTATGTVAWEAELPALLDGCLMSPTDGVLATVHEGVPGEKTRAVALVWIDGATGAIRHRAPLAGLQAPLPRVGPMVGAGSRIWVFSGSGETDPSRNIGLLTANPASNPASKPAGP